MKVIFVGCNPTKRNYDPKVPFKGTRSQLTLEKWIERLGLKEDQIRFINLTNKVTKTQSEIKKSDINVPDFAIRLFFETIMAIFGEEEGLNKAIAFVQDVGKLDPKKIVPFDEEELDDHLADPRWYTDVKVVALGKMAAWGLNKVGVPHYELNHPSGLNRKLNDPKYVDRMIESCRDFLLE